MPSKAEESDPTLQYRTNSLPLPIQKQAQWSSASAILEAPSPTPSSPVPLRILSPAKRKRAQNVRNSVAITNSDYYNQRRPQLALMQIHSGYRDRSQSVSAQALDTISEAEACQSFESKWDGGPLFRYTPNAIRTPSGQMIHHPLSQSLTSLPGSGRPMSPKVTVQPPTAPIPLPPESNSLQVPAICETLPAETSSQVASTGMSMPLGGIPFNPSTEGQFESLYLNRRSGRLYMLENGYYTPLSDEQLEGLKFYRPPVADRRAPSFRNGTDHQKSVPAVYASHNAAPSDCLTLSYVVVILLLICLNFPVALCFSILAIVYALKAKKANREKRIKDANAYSHVAACLNISAVVVHILTVIAFIAGIIILYFVVGVFD